MMLKKVVAGLGIPSLLLDLDFRISQERDVVFD